MRIASLAALWVCSRQCVVEPQRRASDVCGSAICAKPGVRELLATGVGNLHRRENVIFAAPYLRNIPSFAVCALRVITAIPRLGIGIDAFIATRKETGLTFAHVRSGRAPAPGRR